MFLPSRQAGRVPLVLVQQGGNSHKMGQEILDWPAVFVEKHGMALASIVGPVHGDRRAGGAARPTREAKRAYFFTPWQGAGSRIDAMNADCRAVIDTLCADQRIDPDRIGWTDGRDADQTYRRHLLYT